NCAFPVSAETVIVALAPKLMVATAKTPFPFGPGMLTMPSLLMVAANAMMSGTAATEAEKSSVSTPTMTGALPLWYENDRPVGSIGATGVRAMTNVRLSLGARSTVSPGEPMGMFVLGSVGWELKFFSGRFGVFRSTRTPLTALPVGLMTLAKAVAVFP